MIVRHCSVNTINCDFLFSGAALNGHRNVQKVRYRLAAKKLSRSQKFLKSSNCDVKKNRKLDLFLSVSLKRINSAVECHHKVAL
uniref:Uncharacterized protein n=1 Tax=Acanthochromis polyacanthus TaxID=80966 RepID=A0A3Q1ECT0_9TELE